jgi:phosphatidylglycerophosphate synthase
MGAKGTHDKARHDVASGIVIFLGMYQGAVPLAVRLIFDGDQRFAPALWLPSPWWWIACITIVLVAVALLAVLYTGKQRRSLAPGRSQPSEGTRQNNGTAGYEAASAVVLLVGIYNGIAPFVVRLIFDGNQLLALPLRLGAPWWWITSVAVVIVTVVLLTLIDQAKQRSVADD